MKRLIVFDLKGTLVSSDMDIVSGLEEFFTKLRESSKYEIVIYSMNEPWTYRVLARYKGPFEKAQKILLVTKKRIDDIIQTTEGFEPYEVLIVGDGVNEEVRFARQVNIRSLRVNKGSLLELDKLEKVLSEEWL